MVHPRGAARAAGEATRGNTGGDRPRHLLGLLRAGDRGGREHAVATEFHRQRRIRRGPDAGIEDERNRDGLADQFDGVGIADTESAADR